MKQRLQHTEQAVWTSYVRPTPPPPGMPNRLAERLPKVLHRFVHEAAAIRATLDRRREGAGRPTVEERLVRAGLASCLQLLEARAAANLKIRGDGGRPLLEPFLGPTASRRIFARVARELASGRLGARVEEPGTLWYNGRCLIASLSVGAEAGFFLVDGSAGLTPADVRLTATFLTVFEEQLALTQALEVAIDQQRLLRRRTIVAQLRPNDLLYQILKRLHVRLAWRRGACILAPVAPNGEGVDRASVWALAAERLSGVTQGSRRIGSRYSLPLRRQGSEESAAEDLVIDDVSTLARRGSTAWQRLIHRVVIERADLPHDLVPPRSALVVVLRDAKERDEKRRQHPSTAAPYVLVISDPRPAWFSRRHLEFVRGFVAPFAGVLEESARFSRRLVQLWTPTASLGVVEPAEADAERIEATDGSVLAREGPALLGVDALQIIQIRRRAATSTADGLELLAVAAIEADAGTRSDPRDIELLHGYLPGVHLGPAADLLWDVLTRGEERIEKHSGGVEPARVGHLFRGAAGSFYGTVMAMPISGEDGTCGALLAYRRLPSEVLDIEKLLLRSLASRLGEQFAFRRELADRVRLLACLSAVAAAPDRTSAWRKLVEHARELLKADHAFLMAEPESAGQPNEGGRRTIVDVAHTWEEGSLSVPPIVLDSRRKGITGTVYAKGEPLAISDVSKCRFFVPLLGPDGQPVPVASELAVPIDAPRSATRPEQRQTIGVLDALWRNRHDITPRDQSTLGALARHAATLLTLSANREEAEQMRKRLELLLDRSRVLEDIHSEQEVLQWAAATTGELIDCDLLTIGRHARGSQEVELLEVRGARAAELARLPLLKLDGWLGTSLKSFRSGEVKAVVDRYDQPSPLRRHVAGTRRDRHQASIAYFVAAARDAPGAAAAEPRDVWVVWLARFRPQNFTLNEEALLRLTAEIVEAVLRRIGLEIDRTRSSHLLEIARDVALDLVDNVHKNAERVREHIIHRIYYELRACKVCIIYYDPEAEAYDFAARFVHPPDAPTGDQPPRTDGVSESVRKAGAVVIVEDIKNPPDEMADAIRRSRFFKRNPQIRAFVAVPLFERSDVEREVANRFGGVMYVDFDISRVPSPSELEFLATMERFLAECGRLTQRLQWMRERALQRIQSIHDPREVFKQVLDVAREGLEREIPAPLRKLPDFRLGGSLLMVTPGQEPWARLVTRAGWGETTGDFPGVQNIGEGVAGYVAQNATSCRVEDTQIPDPRGIRYLPYLKMMRSELAVPILLPGALKPAAVAKDVIGVLNVECSLPNLFTRRHEKLLALFAQPPVSLILYLAERHGQRLWESKKEDDEFLLHAAGNVLHELTRPIRSLLYSTPAIRRAWPGRMPRDIRVLLAKMEEDGRHWNDLLKIGLLHLNPEVLQGRHLLDVVERIHSWAARKRPYKVKVAKAPVPDFFIARGHAELFQLILDNLYDNSVRELSKEEVRRPRIWISFDHSVAQTGSEEFLDVFFHDNGPGLPGTEEQWRELFRPFSRRSHQHASQGGWGLGLPLVRQMVYLMDGQVDPVGSRPFTDTCFRLRFCSRRLP